MAIYDEWRLADCEKKAREGSECANAQYGIQSDLRQLAHEMREAQGRIESLFQELYERDQRIDELSQRIEILEYPNEI